MRANYYMTKSHLNVPFSPPSLRENEAIAAAEVIRSGWLMQGPKVAEFEHLLAAYCGSSNAIAVSNCTTALHLSLLTLGVKPGDEVICPSLSFIATANSIRYTGASPVFADVDPQTYNLDPNAVEAAITSRTRAIMLVHQLGLPADIDTFAAIAEKHGLALVEDAACAIGSRYKGRRVGGDGQAVCFSFHPRKVITTGEGGLILTDNAAYARTMSIMRQHGMNMSVMERHKSDRVSIENYDFGFNYRMTDLQAAVGIEQLKRLDSLLATRLRAAERYNEALAGHPWLRPPYIPEYAEPTFQSYAIQLTEDAPLSREQVMEQLLAMGVATRRGVMLAHREPAYEGWPCPNDLAKSEDASARSLLLPIFGDITDQQVDYVIDCIGALRPALQTASA
jgi:dTDP-4-amino-4,6-dideoxygalactose transaminase